jgi:hypothetical protein
LVETSAVFGKPGLRSDDQSRSLGGIHREFGRAKATAAPGLDFDEDHAASAPDHQVEFDTPGADVARDDAIPFGFQIVRGPGFALGSQG